MLLQEGVSLLGSQLVLEVAFFGSNSPSISLSDLLGTEGVGSRNSSFQSIPQERKL